MPKKLHATVHAEVAVVVKAMEMFTHLNTVKIGVTKLSCWCCQEFLSILDRESSVTLSWRRSHGKLYAGWRMPSGLPISVATQMQRLITQEMETLLAERQGVRDGSEGRSVTGEDPPLDLQSDCEARRPPNCGRVVAADDPPADLMDGYGQSLVGAHSI